MDTYEEDQVHQNPECRGCACELSHEEEVATGSYADGFVCWDCEFLSLITFNA